MTPPKAGIDFEGVRRIATAMESVVEGRYYGLPAFFIGGRFFAGYRADIEALPVVLTFEDRDFLIRAKPDVFYITDHYRNYPAVLVRLATVTEAEVREVLESAREIAVALGPKRPSKPRRAARPRQRRK